MGQLERLIQKAREGKLTSQEEQLLEFLLMEIRRKYFTEEKLSEKESVIAKTWHKHLWIKKKLLPVSENELNRQTEDSWKKNAQKLGLPTRNKDYSLEVDKIPMYPIKRTVKQLIPIFAGTVAMIIFISILFFMFRSKEEVYFAENSRMEYRLPDNTHVIMNVGSRLTISPRFNKKKREVAMEGEIFFDVAPNKEKAFIIKHGDLVTQVKGTSFTITNYPQLTENKITVNTGLVEVTGKKIKNALLAPGKQLSYNKTTNRCTIEPIDATTYAEWTTGNIVFLKAGLDELTLRLKQHFNKQLIVKDKAFGKEVKLTADFGRDVTAEDIMQSLQPVYNIKYLITDKTIEVYK